MIGLPQRHGGHGERLLMIENRIIIDQKYVTVIHHCREALNIWETQMKTEAIAEFAAHASRILADLHDTKEPVLITKAGKPSAYLVEAGDYEAMRNRMAILEGISRGEAALLAGDVQSHEKAKQALSKWLK